MLLTGTYTRSIDEKLRVAIPKRLRSILELQPSGALYIAPGTDESLALYTEESFSHLAELLGSASPTRQDVRAFSRLFYARAAHVALDRQGRVRIPRELAELAALHKDIVLLGVQDHVELWDVARWKKYLAGRQAHYDEIAETAFSGNDPRHDKPGSM